ncbi:MAG: hypothetical protein L6Q54_14075 [Leptospiraceae bacterium]|nr:hypothetical protein [Leptospiraceae bacterium]MCK6382362.1 hypothetical protein [Leptospiraceae bacterium]NUM40702.1 hypothetical protein [Leptospiraceae bacterium]
MENVVHYSLWVIAFIGFGIPFIGLGVCPAIVVKLVLAAFGGNVTAQIQEGNLLEKFKKK